MSRTTRLEQVIVSRCNDQVTQFLTDYSKEVSVVTAAIFKNHVLANYDQPAKLTERALMILNCRKLARYGIVGRPNQKAASLMIAATAAVYGDRIQEGMMVIDIGLGNTGQLVILTNQAQISVEARRAESGSLIRVSVKSHLRDVTKTFINKINNITLERQEVPAM